MKKKNIVITFRVDEELKEKIDKIAERKEWSTSQVVEFICKKYFKQNTRKEISQKEIILEFYDRIEQGISESIYYEESNFSLDVLNCIDATKNEIIKEFC